MPCTTLRVALTAVVALMGASAAFAQPMLPGSAAGVAPGPVGATDAQPIQTPAARPNTMPQPPSPLTGPGVMPPSHLVQPGYPYLNAPLYPGPVQHVPPQMGRTVITNQALSPHEMLYAHTYKAMYPPFYHKVKGHWVVGPSGICWREDWYLQGTEVKVKYNSHISPFAFFHPPVEMFSRNAKSMGWPSGGFLGID